MLTVTSNVVWPRFVKGNVIHFVLSHMHRIPFIASEYFNGEMPYWNLKVREKSFKQPPGSISIITNHYELSDVPDLDNIARS